MSDDIIKWLREAIAAGPTPGPWVVYDDSNDGKTNRIEVVALGKTVARIYRSVPEEDLPNARLIAAASPDNIAVLLDRLDAAERERDSKAAELANLQVAFSDWKVFHSTARLEAENARLRAERDEHARWREKLADDLHERESQIIDGWAALRDSGVQSEKNIADGIKLLRAENERLRSESKAQLEELDRIDDALGTNEGPSAVDHIVILKTENERLRGDAERMKKEIEQCRQNQ